jgi:N-ethylmaleimide reductase
MTVEDIENTIKDFRHAAQCAKDAGFDGVEIHAANGYLIDQFLCDNSNKRDDDFGGSIENRYKFLSDVIDVVLGVWDAGDVGIRLSPTGTFNGVHDSNPTDNFGYVIQKLNAHNLAYLHIVERFPGIGADNVALQTLETLINQWDGFYMANGDYDMMKAQDAVQAGHAQAITFGRPFIANPDLTYRLQHGVALNDPDQDTFYGGDEHGYTDYPFADENKQAA